MVVLTDVVVLKLVGWVLVVAGFVVVGLTVVVVFLDGVVAVVFFAVVVVVFGLRVVVVTGFEVVVVLTVDLAVVFLVVGRGPGGVANCFQRQANYQTRKRNLVKTTYPSSGDSQADDSQKDDNRKGLHFLSISRRL